jgi:glycosyltransferase involved in cell wall biosynthesis
VSAGRHVVVLSWRDLGNPDGGGAEVFLSEITAGLVARGWAVTQLSAAFPGAAREEWVRGVRVLRRGGRLTVFAHALWWQVSGRLGRHDVVLDVQNGVPFLSPLVTRRPVVVLVHHVHREQWPILFGRVAARLGWWLESRAAVRAYRDCAYVTVSAHTRRELGALGVRPGAIEVVHNGTHPPAAGRPEHATPLVCVLGRIVPHKRVEYAIDAVAQLRAELPDLALAVVGTGEWEPALRRRAAERGVADAVTFHGHVDDAERDRLLAAAWVLALPSVKEGWGLAVMEAAAQGTPSVAFASAGGVGESVVDGLTGLLVEDRAAFVAALRRVLTDAGLRERLGRAAREHAGRFSWEATADALNASLERAAAPLPAAQGTARVPS